MKNKELNEYIQHYIEKDKTKSAILLTSEWGTGKSYYIKNELIPFLKAEKNGAHACIVVSLYGLSGLSEINKSIYIESRAAFLKINSEGKAIGALAAKTVLKGVASFFNVDLEMSEGALQNLYSSIDLSGKLIIFEDIERSSININEFLGYVNSLVEQDEIKVLLVANEKELIKQKVASVKPIKRDPFEEDKNIEFSEENAYTEGTSAYLTTKEKTISDTIVFEGDLIKSITSILSDYPALEKRFTDDKEIQIIKELITRRNYYNLRTFVYACQKTTDILERIPSETVEDQDFIRTIFISIISYSISMKSGEVLRWKENSMLSTSLGNEKYPLFRFCYDFLTFHYFNSDLVKSAQETLRKLRLYDRNKSAGDSDLRILYEWYLNEEYAVNAAVNRLIKRLDDPNDLAFQEYSKIALYLIKIHHITGVDISHAKRKLVSNLEDKGEELDPDLMFPMIDKVDEDPDVNEEYNLLKKEMKASLIKNKKSLYDFTYDAKEIEKLYDSILNNDDIIFTERKFAAAFDNNRIVDMLKICTAKQIHSLRAVFLTVYRAVNIKEFLSDDCDAIADLLEKVKKLLNYENYDLIQLKQIQFFVNNLEEIMQKLNNI